MINNQGCTLPYAYEQVIFFNKNGKANGKSTSYYSNGEISDDFNYKNGLKDGEWKSYSKKGTLKRIEVYKQGLKVGKWVANLFAANTGTKLIETCYYKNNDPTGVWSQQTEDGRLIWEKIYTNLKFN